MGSVQGFRSLELSGNADCTARANSTKAVDAVNFVLQIR